MTVSDPLRVYEPEECNKDGYPRAWDSIRGMPGVKHIVKDQAGRRCIRCKHPYQPGDGEWSACDAMCEHEGPMRFEMHGRTILAEKGAAGLVAGDFVAAGRHVEAQHRVLTVHHLRVGHDQKRDLRWWNLVALCQRCHLSVQTRVDLERPYILEHSEWFKPYVAGFYAWKYEGEEISREEAEARQDELLAYELLATDLRKAHE